MFRVGRTHLKEVLTCAHLSTPFFFFRFFFPPKFTELVRAGVGIPEVSWCFRIAASVFSWGCWTWNVRPLHTPWTHLLQHEWEFRYFFKHVAFLLLALSCFSALFFFKFPWSLCIAWLWGSISPCVSRSDCDLFLLFWESSFPKSNEFCHSGRSEEDYLWACASSWVKRAYLFFLPTLIMCMQLHRAPCASVLHLQNLCKRLLSFKEGLQLGLEIKH